MDKKYTFNTAEFERLKVEKKKNQISIAGQMNLSASTITGWKDSKISEKHLVRLAEILEVDMHTLIDDTLQEDSLLFDEEDVDKFYSQLNSRHIVFVCSSVGFAERSDILLQNSVKSMIEKGVCIRYVFPSGNRSRSLEDYRGLRKKLQNTISKIELGTNVEYSSPLKSYQLPFYAKIGMGNGTKIVIIAERKPNEKLEITSGLMHLQIREATNISRALSSSTQHQNRSLDKWALLTSDVAKSYFIEIASQLLPVEDLLCEKSLSLTETVLERQINSERRRVLNLVHSEAGLSSAVKSVISNMFEDWWDTQFAQEPTWPMVRHLEVTRGDVDGARSIEKAFEALGSGIKGAYQRTELNVSKNSKSKADLKYSTIMQGSFRNVSKLLNLKFDLITFWSGAEWENIDITLRSLAFLTKDGRFMVTLPCGECPFWKNLDDSIDKLVYEREDINLAPTRNYHHTFINKMLENYNFQPTVHQSVHKIMIDDILDRTSATPEITDLGKAFIQVRSNWHLNEDQENRIARSLNDNLKTYIDKSKKVELKWCTTIIDNPTFQDSFINRFEHANKFT